MTDLHELSRPFPDHLIKPAPKGKFGSYVAHSAVTERLLSIVGPFDYEIIQVIRGLAPAVAGMHGTKEDPTYPARPDAVVACLARMTIHVDGRVVSVTEVGDVDEPAMHNDGRNLKDASSDAIKRCAMRVGLGLHLWSQTDYFLDKQLEKDEEDEGRLQYKRGRREAARATTGRCTFRSALGVGIRVPHSSGSQRRFGVV